MMKNTFKKSLAISALGAGLTLTNTVQAELAIVVNPGYSGEKINIEEVRSLFQGKKRNLPNGARAKVVDQSSGSPARGKFLSEVLEQSEADSNRYWSRQIFSGKTRPAVLDSAEAVKRWVALTPQAIGYIDIKDVDRSVKVILRIN